MTQAQANQNIPVQIAAARVSAAGAFLSNDGGFISVSNPATGEYALILAQAADPLRVHVSVAIQGSGDDITWDTIVAFVGEPLRTLIISFVAGGMDANATFSVVLTSF